MSAVDRRQDDINKLNVSVEVIKSQMVDMKVQNDRIEKRLMSISFATTADLNAYKQEVRDNYVTKESFDPIKRLAYGMVALILVSVVGAIVGLVLKK